MPQPSPLQPCPHVPVFVHYLFIFLVTYWTVRVSSEYKKEGRTAALAGALSLDCSDDEGGSPGGGSGGGGQMPVVYSWMKKGFHQPLQGQKSPKSKASLAKTRSNWSDLKLPPKLRQIGLHQLNFWTFSWLYLFLLCTPSGGIQDISRPGSRSRKDLAQFSNPNPAPFLLLNPV